MRLFSDVYVDMDGVLCDWEGGVRRLLGLYDIQKDNYYEVDKARKYYEAIERYQKDGRCFWQALDKLYDERGIWLWDELVAMDLGPRRVLTAYGNRAYGAKEQKRAWVKQHISIHAEVVLVERSLGKALYARHRELETGILRINVLIDDQKRVCDAWTKAGGVAIWHRDVQSTVETLKGLCCGER